MELCVNNQGSLARKASYRYLPIRAGNHASLMCAIGGERNANQEKEEEMQESRTNDLWLIVSKKKSVKHATTPSMS